MDYEEARQLFLTSAARCGARVDIIYQEPDEQDEEQGKKKKKKSSSSSALVCEVARVGCDDDDVMRHALVHVCGQHGVEAVPGSAIQSHVMQQVAEGRLRVPPETTIFFVHMLNPWGARERRWSDKNGVNLMSNWVVRKNPPPEEGGKKKSSWEEECDQRALSGAPPRYKEVEGLFNPRRRPRPWLDWLAFTVLSFFYTLWYGFKVVASVAGFPQYINKRGIFYGGQRRAKVIDAFETYFSPIFSALSKKKKKNASLGVIDIHTGIGDVYGKSHFLTLRDHSSVEKLRKKLGEQKKKVGTLDKQLFRNNIFEYIQSYLVEESVNFVPLHQDFGTKSTLSTLFCLMQENQCFHYERPEVAHDAGNAYRDAHWLASYPQDPKWIESVKHEGYKAVEAVLQILWEKE